MTAPPITEYKDDIDFIKETLSSEEHYECRMTSDSMAPLLRTNDKFWIQKIGTGRLRCGDIILFKYNGRLVAHRFLAFQNRTTILTKGDNQKDIDAPLSVDAVLARVTAVERRARTTVLRGWRWKVTNYLLGAAAVCELRSKKNWLGGTWASLLKVIARLVNPSYRLLITPVISDHIYDIETLIMLARLSPSSEDIALINEHLENQIDWHYLYELILYNNVGPLVHHNLEKINQERIPLWFRDNLKDIYEDSLLKSSIVFKDVAELFDVFRRHDIQVMALKGFALAEALYRDVALRPMEDVDFLVKKEDWPRIKTILTQQGFSNAQNLDPLELERRCGTPMNWHADYTNPRGTKLEPKFYLFALDFPDFDDVKGRPFGSPLARGITTGKYCIKPRAKPVAADAVKRYWDRATPIKIQTTTAQTLSPEDQFVYLSTRMINTGFKNLLWFCELAEFVNRHPELNWQVVLDTAIEKKVGPAIYRTLRALQKKFLITIPDGVLEQLKPSKTKRFLLRLMFGPEDAIVRHARDSKRTPEFLIAACMALNKFNSLRGFGGFLKYTWKILFAPVDYIVYRYKIPRWQVYCGRGYSLRIGRFVSKILRLLKVFHVSG